MPGLRDHKRISRLIERTALRALAAVGDSAEAEPTTAAAPPAEPDPPAVEPDAAGDPDPATDPGPEPGAPARFAREGGVRWLATEEFVASQRLYARLDGRDVAEIEALISDDPELYRIYGEIPDQGSKHQMVMAFGIWLGASGGDSEDRPTRPAAPRRRARDGARSDSRRRAGRTRRIS